MHLKGIICFLNLTEKIYPRFSGDLPSEIGPTKQPKVIFTNEFSNYRLHLCFDGSN